MEQKIRKYDAFISYRHQKNDMAVAEKLQNLLERQKIWEEDGTRKRTLTIFRDQSELPTSDNLGKDIRTALENSRFLIVICSRMYQESKWCMEELNYFRSLHGNTNKNILPILIEGEPEEVFPEKLRWDEVERRLADGSIKTEMVEIEPLAADIRADSLRNMLHRLKSKEYFRIAAPIMGLSFDNLYQRKKRAHIKMIITVLVIIMVLSVLFGLYSFYMFKTIEDKQAQIFENESVRLADAAMTQLENKDYSLALLLADEAYSFFEKSEKGYAYSEAEYAIRSAVFAERFESSVPVLNCKGVIPFQTEGFEIICSLDNGKILQISDGEKTYLLKTDNGQIIESFLGNSFSFNDDLTSYVEINRTGTYEVCFVGMKWDTSEIYFSYVADCRPASYYNAFYDEKTGDCYLFVDEVLCACVKPDGTYVENSKIEQLYPDTVRNKIEKENTFRSYENNCDLNFTSLSIEEHMACSSEDIMLEYTMQLRGYDEIKLTDYNEELVLVSGKSDSDGGVYHTFFYARNLKEWKADFEGRFYLDRSNGLLYQKLQNMLVIYQINENVLVNSEPSKKQDSFFTVSPNGQRCCLMDNHLTDETGQACDYAWVEIFDVNNMDSALFGEEIRMSNPVSVKYQYNEDMSRIIYEDKSGVVYVKDIEQNILWKMDDEACEYIYAVAIEPKGNLVAVAYRKENGNNCIILFDIEKETISQIDLQMYSVWSLSISHIEILKSNLLVADSQSLHLFNLEDESYIKLKGSAAMAHTQKYLTEDNLLFSMISSDGYDIGGQLKYHLAGIYDLKTNEYQDIGCAVYDYDIASGFFVYQEMKENGYVPTIVVMRRQKQGGFAPVWEIKSEKVDMQLLHNGMSLEGNLLLLSGEDTCEVYDLAAKRKIMETGFPKMYLGNELLYYASMDVTNHELNRWQVQETIDELKEEVSRLLNGRVLSEDERKRFYIISQ